MSLLDIVGPEWQEIASPKDADIIAEARQLADAGRIQMQLFGTVFRARLAVHGPLPVIEAAKEDEAVEVPRPDWLLFGPEQKWTPGDGLCENHYFGKKRGEQFLWSTKWWRVDHTIEADVDRKLTSYIPPDVRHMTKTQLFCELRDHGWRTPLVLDTGQTLHSKSAQELLIDIDESNLEGRWLPDGVHSAAMSWLEQARQRAAAYISPSCLRPLTPAGNAWVLDGVVKRRLRSTPWREQWCPPPEIRARIDSEFRLIGSTSRRSWVRSWETLAGTPAVPEYKPLPSDKGPSAFAGLADA